MKQIIFFFLLAVSVSCKGPYITDEDLFKEVASKGNPKTESVLLVKDDWQLISKDFVEGKNYFVRNKNGEEFFLFLTCDFDCGENLEAYSFSDNGLGLAFLTKNSSRIKTKNRLLLYGFENGKPVKKLDTVKDVYKSFRFEGKDFIYTNQNGTETKLSL